MMMASRIMTNRLNRGCMCWEGNLVSLVAFHPGCDLPHFQSPCCRKQPMTAMRIAYLEGIRRPPRSRD